MLENGKVVLINGIHQLELKTLLLFLDATTKRDTGIERRAHANTGSVYPQSTHRSHRHCSLTITVSSEWTKVKSSTMKLNGCRLQGPNHSN